LLKICCATKVIIFTLRCKQSGEKEYRLLENSTKRLLNISMSVTYKNFFAKISPAPVFIPSARSRFFLGGLPTGLHGLSAHSPRWQHLSAKSEQIAPLSLLPARLQIVLPPPGYPLSSLPQRKDEAKGRRREVAKLSE